MLLLPLFLLLPFGGTHLMAQEALADTLDLSSAGSAGTNPVVPASALQRHGTMSGYDVYVATTERMAALDGQIQQLSDSLSRARLEVKLLREDKCGLGALLLVALLLVAVFAVALWQVMRRRPTAASVRQYVLQELASQAASAPAEASPAPISDDGVTRQEMLSLLSRIQMLESEVLRLREKMAFASPRQQSSAPSGVAGCTPAPSASAPATSSARREFYLTRALTDKEFADERHAAPAEDTYYKFTLSETDASKATFVFAPYNDMMGRKALANRVVTIDHACRFQHHGAQSRHFRTLTPGEAVLKNGRWIVTQKALLSYE